MDKKTGMIVSIVGSVVALCLALGCCSSGIYFGPMSDTSTTGIIWAVVGICLGLLPIIGAVLLWVFLVIRKKDDEGVAVEPPMSM
jgi:uncharacterized membrane protein